MFWFWMSAGLALGSFFKFTLAEPYLSSIIDRVTLIGIPLIVTLASRTRFIRKDTFANSKGRLITAKQMPYSFPLATIAGVGITFIVAEVILPKHQAGNFLVSFTFFSCLLSGLSLYFIFKNCPISILFNRKFWTLDFHPNGYRKNNFHRSPSSSSTRPASIDYATNPVYGGLYSNIHNKYRR